MDGNICDGNRQFFNLNILCGLAGVPNPHIACTFTGEICRCILPYCTVFGILKLQSRHPLYNRTFHTGDTGQFLHLNTNIFTGGKLYLYRTHGISFVLHRNSCFSFLGTSDYAKIILFFLIYRKLTDKRPVIRFGSRSCFGKTQTDKTCLNRNIADAHLVRIHIFRYGRPVFSVF